MGQCCFSGWRLSSVVVVCKAAGVWAGRARGQSARRRPGTWAVGRPTLHGGPARLHPLFTRTLDLVGLVAVVAFLVALRMSGVGGVALPAFWLGWLQCN